MQIIGLFFPALITIAICHKRRDKNEEKLLAVLLEYGQAVLFNNLITMGIITYILKVDGVDVEAFNSFPFFTKYVVIAILISIGIPYVKEVGRKCFHIDFIVMDKKDKED